MIIIVNNFFFRDREEDNIMMKESIFPFVQCVRATPWTFGSISIADAMNTAEDENGLVHYENSDEGDYAYDDCWYYDIIEPLYNDDY